MWCWLKHVRGDVCELKQVRGEGFPHCALHPCHLANLLSSNKGIGDAGSTADIGMLWSAIVCQVCYSLPSAKPFALK